MKPNLKGILSIDSSRITADIAADAINGNSNYFKEVINLSLNEKTPLNWRAARVVALVCDEHEELFIPYVNKTAKLFSSFKNDGLKRSYATILLKYINLFDEESLTQIIDVCFKYMLSEEKVAVKYNCMKLLYEITKKIPELRGELQAAIDYNLSENVFRFNGEIKKIYNAIDGIKSI
jgi:hypothetical protein